MVRGPAEGTARGGKADATGAGRESGDEPLRHRQAGTGSHAAPLGHGGGAVQGAGRVLRLVPAASGRAPARGTGAAVEAVGPRRRSAGHEEASREEEVTLPDSDHKPSEPPPPGNGAPCVRAALLFSVPPARRPV